MSAHAEATATGTGTRPRRTRARGSTRDPRDVPVHRVGDHALRLVLHGLLLRPGRQQPAVAAAGVPPAGLRRRAQHVILVTSSFTMHWALQSIKRGNRSGLQAGLVLTFLMGLDVPPDADHGVRPHRLRALRRRLRLGLLLPDRPARRARLRRADAAARRDRPRRSAATSRRSTTTASSSPGSTGTSSTSCGSWSTRPSTSSSWRVRNPLRSEAEAFQFLIADGRLLRGDRRSQG